MFYRCRASLRFHPAHVFLTLVQLVPRVGLDVKVFLLDIHAHRVLLVLQIGTVVEVPLLDVHVHLTLISRKYPSGVEG